MGKDDELRRLLHNSVAADEVDSFDAFECFKAVISKNHSITQSKMRQIGGFAFKFRAYADELFNSILTEIKEVSRFLGGKSSPHKGRHLQTNSLLIKPLCLSLWFVLFD